MRSARRRSGPLLVAVAAVLVAALVWLFGFSSLLGVRHVAVEGSSVVSTGDILAAADIRMGEPMLRVDTAAIEARVGRIDSIASVKVDVSLPSTVTVNVVERTPIGYVADGGGARLVDKDGRQYTTVTSAPADLPQFDIPQASMSRVDARLDGVGRAVATVAAGLPPSILTTLVKISASTEDDIVLDVEGGRRVVWGSIAHSKQKVALLLPLLATRSTLIDVSDPTLVHTR